LADCPNPLVIQTDRFPEPEHGAVYNLTDGLGSIDPVSGRFTGPLAADPNIMVEIRAGGPFIGDRTTVSVMGSDDEVFLGYVATDEAIAAHRRHPTKAVVAPLDINPQIIMWDPQTYDIERWSDVKATAATIHHFAGASYVEFLESSGLVTSDQLDGNYTGAPGQFIAANGRLIQQGFVTQEPYVYENVFTDWGRPVEYLLVHDAGYELYQGALAILDRRLDDAASSCLSALVPLIQQSIVDFQHDPATTNRAILEAVTDLDGLWTLTDEGARETVVQMGVLGIVGNGPDGTVGNFDLDRVNEVIAITAEQLDSVIVSNGLTAEDLVTNDFIDPSIGL
jgi:hypothetical protein